MATDGDRHGRGFGCVFMCYSCRIAGVCGSLDGAYLLDKPRPAGRATQTGRAAMQVVSSWFVFCGSCHPAYWDAGIVSPPSFPTHEDSKISLVYHSRRTGTAPTLFQVLEDPWPQMAIGTGVVLAVFVSAIVIGMLAFVALWTGLIY